MVAVLLLWLSLSAVFEFSMHALRPKSRLVRLLCASLAIAALAISCTSVWLVTSALAAAFFTGIGAYRAFNICRIVRSRMHEQYLWRTTYRTGLWLLMIQLLLLGVSRAGEHLSVPGLAVRSALLILQLLSALLLLLSVRSHARRMRTMSATMDIPIHDKDLPSLTVAVPARNETDDLDACIAALLASNYPKLEIIVLDDCSQTTRTPEIIRGFAHDGVRFIQGQEPRDTWLAKNQAYDALAKDANGDILLFMGVDIRVEPNTLRKLVNYAVSRHKDMVCVMPLNSNDSSRIPLIQPMRYVWELALPRRRFDRPPVLSSCWLITKSALKKAGGFEAASRMVVPEAYLAKRQLEHDGYSFIASGEYLGVTSTKSIREQRDTAVRVTYPQLHRRPEWVALITAAYGLWVCIPAWAVLHELLSGHVRSVLALVLAIVLAVSWMYAVIFRLAYGRSGLLRIISFPLAALVYVGLLNYSMYKYEFSEVLWKGRNVCLPVMHVIPKLPSV